MGFEPTVPFPVHALSRRVPSATRPSLQRKDGENSRHDASRRRGRDGGGISSWRRGRDSNPRYGFPYADLANLCLQPLGHLSGTRETADHSRRGWLAPRFRGSDRARIGGPIPRSRAQFGGEGGIRTLETLSRLAVFKTAAFDRSATSPRGTSMGHSLVSERDASKRAIAASTISACGAPTRQVQRRADGTARSDGPNSPGR